MSRPFAPGDQVLLIDVKKRRYLLTLTEGKEFHSHSGVIGHDAVIGAVEGTTFRSTPRARCTRRSGPRWPTSC